MKAKIPRIELQKEGLLRFRTHQNVFQIRFDEISNVLGNKGDRIFTLITIMLYVFYF